MKNILTKPNYDFIRTNPDLKHIIYLTLSGSYGYGTNNEHSDIDLRGVLIEPDSSIFGLYPFEQYEDQETDSVIYGLKKFIRLCTSGNPNALELLGTEQDDILFMNPLGQILRDHAHLFLSQNVIQSFGNYATAQLRRLQNALCHDSYEEQEQNIHLRNTLCAQLQYFETQYQNFEHGSIYIYEDKDQDNTQLYFDVNLKHYPIKEFVGIYSELNNTIRNYNKLNHRNRKKDDAHLFKHAMHLIRLLITGTDILNGKGIITKRTAEHSFLMDLRNGKYSYEEIFELTNHYQAVFQKAAESTALLKKPDMDKINNLLIELYHHYL